MTFIGRTALALLFLFLLTPAFAIDVTRALEPLVVHEWGTFTSVASEDGTPVKWAPLSGPEDLPCFVARLGPYSPKATINSSGLVRMETPVLYFYSPRPITLSVGIRFPQGWITEWYPHAASVSAGPAGLQPGLMNYRDGRIEWNSVEVLPGENPEFPSSKRPSHYYFARETDSAPLRIGKQWEKLIFYRGIGNFDVPVRPSLTAEGRIKLRNAGTDTIPLAIVFENRAGRVGYRMTPALEDVIELDSPELSDRLDDLRRELAANLVEFGLYPKEALAMVKTWHDSWFEEGMRVFYIVPRSLVDSVLPLDVKPMPTATARVFVGRVEILSKQAQETINVALATGDARTLTKFGRFLEPFVSQIERTTGKSLRSAFLQTLAGQQFNGPRCME